MKKIVIWFDFRANLSKLSIKYVYFVLQKRIIMATPLNISTVFLRSETDTGRIFDMTGRCAFAICAEGDFDIRILNVEYHVEGHCIFACMPFVNVEILRIRKNSTIILGGIMLEDVLAVVNQTVNSSNLLAIQQTPLVHIADNQFTYLKTSIEGYLNEISDSELETMDNTCNQIHKEIISCHSRLIVAQVMKIYFKNMPMQVRGYTNRDIVFQLFMLDLYANCREQRNVYFYASRSAVSLKYFSTIVRQLSGKSPSDLIETVVVGEAKSMLHDIHRSIKDIATALNFPDSPTFTKYFQRVTGMTPKSYRQSIIS